MVELTLLEIDVDVDSVTARAYAPFARSVGGDEMGERTDVEVETEDSGGRSAKAGLAAALVGLVFLLVAALLLRRYFTEGEEEAEDVETSPVTIEEPSETD